MTEYDLERFKSVRVTEEWIQENHPLLLARAQYLADHLASAKETDSYLYYITGRYRGKRFFQIVFVEPYFVENEVVDFEQYQRGETLKWARENYEAEDDN